MVAPAFFFPPFSFMELSFSGVAVLLVEVEEGLLFIPLGDSLPISVVEVLLVEEEGSFLFIPPGDSWPLSVVGTLAVDETKFKEFLLRVPGAESLSLSVINNFSDTADPPKDHLFLPVSASP